MRKPFRSLLKVGGKLDPFWSYTLRMYASTICFQSTHSTETKMAADVEALAGAEPFFPDFFAVDRRKSLIEFIKKADICDVRASSCSAFGQSALKTVVVWPITLLQMCSAQCGQKGDSMMTDASIQRRSRPACIPAPVWTAQSRYRSRARRISKNPAFRASRKSICSHLRSAMAMSTFMSFSKALSKKVQAGRWAPLIVAIRSPFAPSSISLSEVLMKSSSVVSIRIAVFAVARAKLASSDVSPASAQANRTASAEKLDIPSCIMMKFPFDLDIFSASTRMCPFAYMPLGHRSGRLFHTSQWLNRAIVRWFGIRSLAETRRSIGYQYSNSVRSSSNTSAWGELGLSPPKKM
mmetsp:Transcript_9857/g.37146  ORF Transcript_9857/g.37146 Transcript_9857/m.37146 type:complete len:351 (-) Transcript_9857:2107-3159(-)